MKKYFIFSSEINDFYSMQSGNFDNEAAKQTSP